MKNFKVDFVNGLTASSSDPDGKNKQLQMEGIVGCVTHLISGFVFGKGIIFAIKKAGIKPPITLLGHARSNPNLVKSLFANS